MGINFREAITLQKTFNPDEPRDERGRWTSSYSPAAGAKYGIDSADVANFLKDSKLNNVVYATGSKEAADAISSKGFDPQKTSGRTWQGAALYAFQHPNGPMFGEVQMHLAFDLRHPFTGNSDDIEKKIESFGIEPPLHEFAPGVSLKIWPSDSAKLNAITKAWTDHGYDGLIHTDTGVVAAFKPNSVRVVRQEKTSKRGSKMLNLTKAIELQTVCKLKSHAKVGYQDHPNGDKRCSGCSMFVAGNPPACTHVAPPIEAHGYCDDYEPLDPNARARAAIGKARDFATVLKDGPPDEARDNQGRWTAGSAMSAQDRSNLRGTLRDAAWGSRAVAAANARTQSWYETHAKTPKGFHWKDGVLVEDDAKKAYNPDEPRDEKGMWSSSGGGISSATAASIHGTVEGADISSHLDNVTAAHQSLDDAMNEASNAEDAAQEHEDQHSQQDAGLEAEAVAAQKMAANAAVELHQHLSALHEVTGAALARIEQHLASQGITRVSKNMTVGDVHAATALGNQPPNKRKAKDFLTTIGEVKGARVVAVPAMDFGKALEKIKADALAGSAAVDFTDALAKVALDGIAIPVEYGKPRVISDVKWIWHQDFEMWERKPGLPSYEAGRWHNVEKRTVNVLFMRHGPTRFNNQTDMSKDRVRSWNNVPLTDEGIEDAQKAGEKLKDEGIGYIVSSDLGRAIQTSKIVGKAVGVKPIHEYGMRPWNLGKFTGQTTDEAHDGILEHVENPDKEVEGGESFNTFKARAAQEMLNQIKKAGKKKMLVVSHHRNERLFAAMRPDGTVDAKKFMKTGEDPGDFTEMEFSTDELQNALRNAKEGSGEAGVGKARSFAQVMKDGPADEPRDAKGMWTSGGGDKEERSISIPMSPHSYQEMRSAYVDASGEKDPKTIDAKVSDLRATQDKVYVNPEHGVSSAPIHGMRDSAGNIHVINGHHRADAAARRGDDTIKVKVFDLKKSVAKVWGSNAELPDGVRNALPGEAQTVWRKVANDRIKAGQSEESAIRQAWTAVKNGWSKTKDGWVRKHWLGSDGLGEFLEAELAKASEKAVPIARPTDQVNVSLQLIPLDDQNARSPFPYDQYFFSNLRNDQKERVLAALTDQDSLEERDIPLSMLSSIQDRVDPLKVQSMIEGAPEQYAVVVRTAPGRYCIVDGHHRLTAALLSGVKTVHVRFLDIENYDPTVHTDDNPGAKGEPINKSIDFTIAKVDHKQMKVFGWASVTQIGDEIIVDKQGDIIPDDELEKAIHDYMLYHRSQGDMHERMGVGRCCEATLYNQERWDLGFRAYADPESCTIKQFGAFVGFKVDDPNVWERIESGDLPEFSIGGKARREAVDA